MLRVIKSKRDKMVKLEGVWEVSRVEKEILKNKTPTLFILQISFLNGPSNLSQFAINT